ncbi:hypothetical protein [Paenibacillus campi]|uniref:hypothetical protein n=1 Tax=Paenibacillus campi TaxID=3106031 RepID=UPI002AFE8371|nr:hypothetical protein [Paenibacillus sp. SGZ-1009]
MYANEPLKKDSPPKTPAPVSDPSPAIHSGFKSYPLRQLQQYIGNQATRHYIQRMYAGEEKQAEQEKQEQAWTQPYHVIFEKLKAIEAALSAEDKQVASKLQMLKQTYDQAANTIEKLKVADQLSADSNAFSDDAANKPLQEIKRVLTKFPHVILEKDDAVSLGDLITYIDAIDVTKTREIGLLNITDNEKKSQRMGLFIGPNKPGLAGAGASVGAPGSSSLGFENYSSNFIAHTHPRTLATQKAHTQELATDIQGAQSMEIVRAASGETLFYDQEGAKNQPATDRPGFTSELREPTQTKDRITSFTNLPSSKKYKPDIPEPKDEDKDAYIAKANQEAKVIWQNVMKAQKAITEDRLTVIQFNASLLEMSTNYKKLEDANLETFKEWREKFPTEDKPVDVDEFDPLDPSNFAGVNWD